MTDLAAERFALTSARSSYEAARRELRTAEIRADDRRTDDGTLPVVDPNEDPERFAEIQALRIALDTTTVAHNAAKAQLEAAAATYDAAARQAPLFDSDNTEPVLLLPVRIEAIYPEGASELRIRVYPDDVHVDTHEPALTEGERAAGVTYWRAVRAAGADAAKRTAAWQALVGSCGGSRTSWVRECLTPTAGGAGEPVFPEVELRPEAWTRAAHTQLLPDHFEFSAYRDGALVWRHAGAPISDTLAVGIAPQPGDGAADPDTLAFDDKSRWLVDFTLAKEQGMAIVVPLDDPGERYDLLTVLGVGTQDVATGAARVQQMLAAHAHSGGLTPLPVGTPTNNTPGTRSGWFSRATPPEPEVVAAWRAAFDADGDQEAARLARALGVDGSTVLAGVCDPAGGEENLLLRLHALQAEHYAWSPALRPVTNVSVTVTPNSEPWFTSVAEHYTNFVRARGPLPPLRIGRQPYGLLPISATHLWRGDDVDERISDYVASFLSAFALRADRAQQIGEGADQDAVLLDLLSREASPRRLLEHFFAGTDLKAELGRPPESTVGAIPAAATLAWIPALEGPGPDEFGGNRFNALEAFPTTVPVALQQISVEHLLIQLLVLFDEGLQQMGDTLVPPDPQALDAVFNPLRDRLAQLVSPPTLSVFYQQAESVYNGIYNTLHSGPDLPDRVAERVAIGLRGRDAFASYVLLEDEASADLPRFERLFRETFEPLSSRIDAWVCSLATARLAAMRTHRPEGIRTGAYGWLTDVEPEDPNPTREGYVVTPSMHHATTAAVLRSGWQAHSDRRAFAVDVQSARVRRAQAVIDGVRSGQTVSALLGYQFERALHDGNLDRLIAGFRAAYPLAPLVEPTSPGSDEAKVAIGARNVADGQALRRDRQRLDGDAALAAVVAPAALNGDAPAVRRLLGELDETFDAAGDLLLAESVHQLVGGSALRAGLAADAAGRGQDLPADYDVLRTPRGGIGVSHHVGVLFGDTLAGGWNDDRPLVALEPGLEGWLRHRFGPASKWALGASGWCALDLLIAPHELVRAAVAAAGPVDEASLTNLRLLCERLRSALSTSAPLAPTHFDPADPAPATGYDLDELRDRVGGWLALVRAAAAELTAAATPEAVRPILVRLGALGVPVGQAGDGDVDRVRALFVDVDTSAPGPTPDPESQPAEADAWIARQLAVTVQLLHAAIRVAPRLVRALPPSPQPPVDPDTVAGWLQDMTLVRPKVDALDGAAVGAELLAGTAPPDYVVAQAVVSADGAGPWIAVAPPAEGPRPRSALVLQRDGAGGAPVHGLVVDSWTEVVPRAPGEDGPEEGIGVAFDFDRPGARAPQAMLIVVPPDPGRGWCAEDLHACLDEVLLLARIRTLDLKDLPELRTVLPIPDGRS